MKSINYLFFRNYGQSLIYVILALFTPAVLCSPPCGLYGAPPCQFLPAPPGQTPSCARPGKTYCEHIENYPTYLIKHLVHKWGYEAKNLLVDETWDEFASLSWHETSHFYDPAFIFPQHNHKDSISVDFNGYKYNTPRSSADAINTAASKTAAYAGENAFFTSKTTEQPTFLLYSSAGQLSKQQVQSYSSTSSSSSQVTPNNPTIWLKRIVRDLSEERGEPSATMPQALSDRHSRDVSINMDLLDIVGVERKRSKRVKRQSAGRTSLCETRSQFITPQAALNSKGNWMFVVNEMNTARQMVKAELCASSTCANLCQLPNGYNSRCEQKFVQKRLIALQASGENLYTDVFWFPSCCVCTISSN